MRNAMLWVNPALVILNEVKDLNSRPRIKSATHLD